MRIVQRTTRKQTKKKNLGFYREQIEGFCVALIAAVIVKQFALEAFAVPTESMEPAIIGRSVGGDRIIVNKFVYELRDPRRWEIVVFRYPLNRALNYVKRLVGMPDEWLFIRNGDIYTAPKSAGATADEAIASGQVTIQRKPDGIQQPLFEQLTCIPPGGRGVDRFRDYWKTVDGSAGKVSIDKDAGEIVVDGRKGLTRVRFERPERERRVDVRVELLTDAERGRATGGGSTATLLEESLTTRRFDDRAHGAPPRSGVLAFFGFAAPAEGNGDNDLADEVGDLRLRAEVNPDSGGSAVFEIRDGTHGQPIVVRLGTTSDSSALTFGDERIAIDAALESGTWTEVEVANVDDRVTVRVGGEVVLRHDYTHDWISPPTRVPSNSETLPPQLGSHYERQPTESLPHENGVLFGADGGEVRVRQIDLARDLYYTISGATDFDIPPDSYLMLGDNSTSSLDCRAFKESELHYKDDDGEVVVMLGDAEGVSEAPTRPNRNPYVEDGELRFLDHHGNTHVLERDRIVDLHPHEDAYTKTHYRNFVHRRHVLGRAYVRFWPPMRIGITR